VTQWHFFKIYGPSNYVLLHYRFSRQNSAWASYRARCQTLVLCSDHPAVVAIVPPAAKKSIPTGFGDRRHAAV